MYALNLAPHSFSTGAHLSRATAAFPTAFFLTNSPTAVHVSQNPAIWQWMSLINMTKVMVTRCFFLYHYTAAHISRSNFQAHQSPRDRKSAPERASYKRKRFTRGEFGEWYFFLSPRTCGARLILGGRRREGRVCLRGKKRGYFLWSSLNLVRDDFLGVEPARELEPLLFCLAPMTWIELFLQSFSRGI